MNAYKTLDEFFPDGKPDGRKFMSSDLTMMDAFQPYFRETSGKWAGVSGGLCMVYNNHALFREYVEPKKTKKITMYKPVFKGYENHHTTNNADEWHTDKHNFVGKNIVGWLEMTCEVEE